MVWSLFVDGLPLEMTWDGLLQIFRGEGEILEAFVSQKMSHKCDCRFGFVRFKRLDEARSAVRNLDGVKIRGKTMKVSFAKYDKDGKPWNESMLQEDNKLMEKVWIEGNHKENVKGGRSFKEVVVGVTQHQRTDDWELKLASSLANEDGARNLNKVNLKDLVVRVVEEVCKPGSMEEIKQNIGVVVVTVLKELLGEEEFLVGSAVHMTAAAEHRMGGGEEATRAFLEEDLLQSMMHNFQHNEPLPIGSFENPLMLEGSSCSGTEVGPMHKLAEEECFLIGSNVQAQTTEAHNSVSKEMGLESSRIIY